MACLRPATRDWQLPGASYVYGAAGDTLAGTLKLNLQATKKMPSIYPSFHPDKLIINCFRKYLVST